MGMYDEVGVTCPACGRNNVFQSKRGPCVLATYTLDSAPLTVVADLNEDGKLNLLRCEHCGVQLEIPVRFIATVRVKNSTEDFEMREV